jgi:hypothetical protein
MNIKPVALPVVTRDETLTLQRACNRAGESLMEDGAFGPLTAAAVLRVAVRVVRCAQQLERPD